ncbi:MAG: peptidoglycan DD-metalloendopeptidase family protein [Dehalococcoidia bacterium]
MTLVLGVAFYAVLTGSAGSSAVAPLPAEVVRSGVSVQEDVAGLEMQQPLVEGSSSSSNLQFLPPITELHGVPAAQVTSTAETRVQSLNRALQTTPTPAPTATATPVPRQLTCERSDSPAYCIYTVRDGDTLGSIAADFGLKSAYMPSWELLVASNKPDIVSADDFLQPGQKLRVPTRNGIVHTVILDETVGDLAEMFDVTSAEIIAVNSLGDGNLLATGVTLIIPDPKQLPQPKSEADPATPGQPDAPTSPGAPAPTATPEPPKGFIWPIGATIRITSYFGPSHPLGIDFGLSHAPGTPVMAVMPGKVTFAGGDACCSYGYYVIVDHGNGLKTLYAHLRSISVSVGQTVSQGQTLGPSGTTGYSTGVHLHFEVHKNGVRVNPLQYLPQ